jgi:GTPase
MRFVDEAKIRVEAGKGGDGCVSFRREKFVPFGGPDGGDGGDGGSIFLLADSGINTLVDFRYTRQFKAQNGGKGAGNERSGKKGQDLIIKTPVGTMIYDSDSGELLGDLTRPGETFCLAKGGGHGLGNVHFKSSVNRAPRRATKGQFGEKFNLRLELKVLADVGLLGLPNAGKSTFIRAISQAKPKVADYPFTTLYPHLGVVRISHEKSFVVADIPGIIEGASEGAGLGIQFLKHLSRTELLLHLVDLAPTEIDSITQIQAIWQELANYSQELMAKEQWLVFTKIDLLSPEEAQARSNAIIQQLQWKKPYFLVSALEKKGLNSLCYDIMEYLNSR